MSSTPQLSKSLPRTPQLLRGFRDFLPEEAAARQWLRAQMVSVFERWGYEPLETPTLEPLELFKGEIGEDEKLFFKFMDLGGREVALRYDQTVPTCRVIGQYADQLTFPFRRYQIQSAFRAEKPQRGRYREFTQADIDIFGVKSPLADAEAIAVSIDLYKSLGFKKAIAVINNRDLVKDIPYMAIVAVDKLKKIGDAGVIAEMESKGITSDLANHYLEQFKNLKPDSTIKQIFSYLKGYGFPEDWYRFEPTLARSFSYSQGPIWEMVIPEYGAGSVGGGERYDGMVERITGQKIPATGIAFGFDRTLEAAIELGLCPSFKTSTKTLVTVFSPELFSLSLSLSRSLRSSGVNTDLYPDPSVKLDKQLKYADKKGIPFVVIVGPDEATNGTVTVKDMATKTQTTMPLENLTQFFQNHRG